MGYIHGPQEIVTAINQLLQYAVFSSSSIAQYAALTALTQPNKLDIQKYRQKRDYLMRIMSSLGFEVKGADGAFYLFLKAPMNMSDIEFTEIALNSNLIIVPGRAFPKMHGYFRLSYGANFQTIQAGAELIKKITDSLK